MKNNFHKAALIPLFLLIITQPVIAEEGESFSGRIGIGFMTINSGNNLNPDGSKKYLENLDSAADLELTSLPMILPTVFWDIGENQEGKLFFNTKPPIDEVGSFVFNMGGSYSVEGTVNFSMSLFFTPFEEVWQNPYLTGENRSTSDTSKLGLLFSANKVMGTYFSLHFVYLGEEVDDDAIGALLPEMARDGAVYSIGADYRFRITDTFEVRPQVSLRKGEYDGESISFTKIKAKLKASYRNGNLMLNPEVYCSYKEHDETDRIFNLERDNLGYGISLMANYMTPFDWQDWSVVGLLGYSRGNSNITFYDTEAAHLGLFLSYNF